MSLANLKIGVRLGAAFATTLLLMVALIAVGIVNMAHIEARLDEIVNENNHKMKLSNDMSEAVHIVSRVLRTIVLLHEPAAIDVEEKKIELARDQYNAAWDVLNKTATNDAGKAIRAKIKEAQETARALNNRVLELGHLHKDAEAISFLLKQASPATQKWQDALDENIKLQEEATKHDAEAAAQAYVQARTLMLVLGAVAIALGVLLAWWITRSITAPMRQAVSVASAVAQGDLTQRIEVKTKDETGQLLQALQDMNENLAGIVGDVRSSTDSISTAAREIAAGNVDLSQRTEEQASSLEETASSMEELTSTVKQNAENAKQANQLAASASDIAIKGRQVVGEVVGTMSSINQSSKKIVDIISVIDGIAFQTNILALNAAVEAARAGEQGRGFAVVATEVRNLAQRSAAAAKEIKDLINDSVSKVETGSRLVNDAGVTMEEIVTSVKRVTDIMAEISAASIEQSAGIEQINQAVAQMDQVTQQNAALVEQAAAASESMQEQAQNLTIAVSTFRLAEGGKAGGKAAGNEERRGAQRAANVTRLPVSKGAAKSAAAAATSASTGNAKPRPAKAASGGGAEDEWEEF